MRYLCLILWASQVALGVKNLPSNAGDIRVAGSIPGWEDPLEAGMEPTPVFLHGESHGQGAWRATVHRLTKSQA